MTKKSFHNLLKGVSVLPALFVVPAIADPYAPAPSFVDDYVASLSGQFHDVLANQNISSFEIGKVTIGTDMSSVGEHSFMYGVSSVDNATQYVKMEQAGIPTGTSEMYFHIPNSDAYNGTFGLTSFKLWAMQVAYGDSITQPDNSAIVTLGKIATNTGNFLSLASINETPWLLTAMDNAFANGMVEERYLTAGNTLVIDGNYGNMVGEFLDTYEDDLTAALNNLDYDYLKNSQIFLTKTPDAIIRGLFGFWVYELEDLGDEGRATAVHNYFQQFADGLDDLESLKLKIGEVAVNGGNVTFANDVDITTSKLDINNGANVLIDEGASVGVILDNISITYNEQYATDEPVTSTQNYTVQGATISGANTHVMIADNASLTIAGNQLDVMDGASLVNNGTLNIMTQTNNLDADLTGNGTLVVYENNIVNVGTHNITQDTIALNGTMNATVRGGNSAQFNANTFNGSGNLNLSFATTGTYHVFGNNVFGEDGEGDVDLSGINVDSSLYNLNWLNNGKDLKVSLKSADNIANDNGLSGDAAVAVAGMAGSSSAVLNDLAVQMQEKLAEGTPGAIQEVEQAAASINPETESVSKTVAHSIQNTLTDLVNSRMAILNIGRSAGDSTFASGGVWAQGLYNKTKMNEHFDGYTRGVALGLDGRINHDITIGAGYAFNNSDIVSRGHDIDIDSNTVFVYGQYKPSGWFANGIMNYTWSEYTEKGLSTMLPTSSKYNADSFGAALAGGYEFNFGLALGLGARYMHVNGESYTDSLGTKKKFDSTDYLTTMFGAKYGLNIKASENMSFRPELRYALKYDVLYDATHATVMMPGTTAYTLTGDRLPRIGNEFGLGLMMRYRAMSLSLSYDIEVREDYTSQTGMARLRYKF